MEKNEKIELINEIKKMADKHPSKKHDEDHADLWKAIKLCANAMKEIEERLWQLDTTDSNIYETIAVQVEKINKQEQVIIDEKERISWLKDEMKKVVEWYPKLTTMKKSALLIDGDNIIDTLEVESWRYLKVQYITPTEWNDYAKLDAVFSWDIIEVTNWKYDLNIRLGSDTEWETATMTVNVDLLLIKF